MLHESIELRYLLTLLLLILLTGCVSGTITQAPDGSCSAEFTSVFKSADNVTLCGATASRSTVNTETIGAILQALAPH